MEQIRTENRMGTEPIPKLILKMSFPMMMSMLVLALYNVVDSIFVSRLSEDALTAVSLVFPYQMLIVAVAVGTGVGINSLISRRLGEKRFDDANLAAGNGQFLALVAGAVFALVFGLFTPAMVGAFKPEKAISDLSVQYLFIVGTFCPFSMMQVTQEKTIAATGNTVYPMLIQLAGAVFNLIFDPILIFGLLGFPKLGVAGAAIATVGGQFFGMILGFILLYKKTPQLKIKLKGFRPHGRTILDIYKVGAPSIVIQAIGSVANFGLNKILIGFTSTAVSVLGVYFKLQSFVFMPVFGLNGGTMPIVGYNYGAKNKQRVLQAIKFGCIYAVIIMLIGLAVFQFIPDKLLGLFDASPNMTAIGVRALRTISICFPFAAVAIMFSTVFQAIGDGLLSMLISISRQLVVLLPAAYILASTLGLDAIWSAFPIAEGASMVLSTVFFILTYSRRIKPLGLENRDN